MSETDPGLYFLINPAPLVLNDSEYDFIQKKEYIEDNPCIYAKLHLHELNITDPNLVSKYIRDYKFDLNTNIKTNILISDYFNLTVSSEIRRLIELGKIGIPELLKLKTSTQDKINNCVFRKSPINLPDEAIQQFIRYGIIRFYSLNGERIILSSKVYEYPIGYLLRNILSDPNGSYLMRKSEYDHYLKQNYSSDYVGSRDEIFNFAIKIGMLIPPYAIDYYSYYMENYKDYENVVMDSVELNRMTDEKIFSSLGLYFVYYSRKDLLSKSEKIMYDLTSSSNIISFIPYNDYFVENSINKNLPCSFDDLGNVLKNKEALCYGNFLTFVFLSKNEIIDTLGRTNFPDFVFPQFNPTDTPGYTPLFDINDKIICKIFELMTVFPKDERTIELSKYIRQKITIRSRIGTFYYNLHKEYISLDIETQTQIKEWMETLFILGMYFRRWDGKGNYPMSDESTRILSGEYADKMGCEYLHKLENMYQSYNPNAKEYISSFPMFDHHNYNNTINICKENKSIYNFLMETVYKRSAYCIRVASSYVIATSYTFHSKILEKEIPNFYIFNMDHIG